MHPDTLSAALHAAGLNSACPDCNPREYSRPVRMRVGLCVWEGNERKVTIEYAVCGNRARERLKAGVGRKTRRAPLCYAREQAM